MRIQKRSRFTQTNIRYVTDDRVEANLSDLHLHEPGDEQSRDSSSNEVNVAIKPGPSEERIVDALEKISRHIKEKHLQKPCRLMEKGEASGMLMWKSHTTLFAAAREVLSVRKMAGLNEKQDDEEQW
jgi:hypothetical protein